MTYLRSQNSVKEQPRCNVDPTPVCRALLCPAWPMFHPLQTTPPTFPLELPPGHWCQRHCGYRHHHPASQSPLTSTATLRSYYFLPPPPAPRMFTHCGPSPTTSSHTCCYIWFVKSCPLAIAQLSAGSCLDTESGTLTFSPSQPLSIFDLKCEPQCSW